MVQIKQSQTFAESGEIRKKIAQFPYFKNFNEISAENWIVFESPLLSQIKTGDKH